MSGSVSVSHRHSSFTSSHLLAHTVLDCYRQEKVEEYDDIAIEFGMHV